MFSIRKWLRSILKDEPTRWEYGVTVIEDFEVLKNTNAEGKSVENGMTYADNGWGKIITQICEEGWDFVQKDEDKIILRRPMGERRR